MGGSVIPVSEKTNPLLYNGESIEIYKSMEEMIDDIKNTDPHTFKFNFERSKYDKELWFKDNRQVNKIRKDACVVALVEKAKNDLGISKIIKFEEFYPSDFEQRNS